MVRGVLALIADVSQVSWLIILQPISAAREISRHV
jgi:hypothetical protein